MKQRSAENQEFSSQHNQTFSLHVPIFSTPPDYSVTMWRCILSLIDLTSVKAKKLMNWFSGQNFQNIMQQAGFLLEYYSNFIFITI